MSRLEAEKSPYLLQHADNPVEWYPWGDDAFTRAREENKLIFLSIGYSTCHWCHVMAHECFEDDDVAALLRANYISIKVDREERPDIDHVYMEVCQRLTGSGGWPLTIIMMPDGRPFYAATYIPKHGRQGRPGLVDLLPWVVNKWDAEPEFLSRAADEIVSEMQKKDETASRGLIKDDTSDEAVRLLKKSFDPRHGGFGRAPKFPRAHDLSFLLNYYLDKGDRKCLDMVEKTLELMRLGGIYDHLGGGFHRYSTDEKWLVPHFEKMLYDQCGLVLAYLEAWQATSREIYAKTAKDVLGYLSRELSSPVGAFYSAEDADSEGEEGTFYLWTKQEVVSLLGAEAEPLCSQYNITAPGNYHDEVSGALTGKNIPYMQQWQDIDRYADLKARLFDERSKRPRPHLDDKVITAWNGMAISAFARASQVLENEGYYRSARSAAQFVIDHLITDKNRLLRRYRDGESAIQAFSEDYVYAVRGLLDLYDCDYDINWLCHANDLTATLINLFQDPETGRLYDTSLDAEELLIRPSSTFDGAVPAAPSIAIEVLARLFLLTGQIEWRDAADNLIRSISSEVCRYPAGYTQLLLSSQWLFKNGVEVVVVTGDNNAVAKEMLAAVRSHGPVQTVVHYKTQQNADNLSKVAPFTENMSTENGQSTAYVCQGFSCQSPVITVKSLIDLLVKHN